MKKYIRKVFRVGISACLATLLFISCACDGETEIEVCEHNWILGAETKATCTENGEKSYTCSLCGETKKESIPALGHDLPKTGTTTREPTCAEEGVSSYVCTVCGETITEPIAVTGHTYDQSEITTAPTCFGAGVRTVSCSVCGDSYTESVDPTGHTDDDFDGTCDGCGNFVGEIKYDVADTVPYVGGPWENPEGFSWWSYGLEKSPSEEPLVIAPSEEQTHTAGKKSVKVDFTNGSKCTPDNPGGAYVIHLGMDHLIRKSNYTLTFYAWASEDFTGTLNKMLDNDNFGPGTSMEAISYQKIYGAEEIAGKGWVEVTLTFVANNALKYSDRSCLRIAFDVGTEGWKGQLYLADFTVSLTDYLRVQEGLPPLNEPTKPVNTTPVLDEIPENAVLLPDDISEDGVWLPGPLTFGEGIVSIDHTVEYAKGGKSVLFNTGKALNVGKESGFILPIPDLEAGKRYELTFYAQGSETYNGALNDIFENRNYTFMNDDGTETPTMLDVIVNAAAVYTEGAMQARDWQKITVLFTANPKEGLCSMRVQMTQKEGYRGQLWLSGFEINDAPETLVDTPQVSEPVLNEVSGNHVPLPSELAENAPWLAGPGYWGDAIFSIDESVEYAKGAKSIAIDYNKAATGNESALFLSFSGLETGKRYELTFYAQGSGNFNGALNDIFENRNYTFMNDDGTETATMLEVEKDPGMVCSAGAFLGAGWMKVSVIFTANPKEGLCSLRMQLTKQENWEGTLWLSYFEIVEVEAEPVTGEEEA